MNDVISIQEATKWFVKLNEQLQTDKVIDEICNDSEDIQKQQTQKRQHGDWIDPFDPVPDQETWSRIFND